MFFSEDFVRLKVHWTSRDVALYEFVNVALRSKARKGAIVVSLKKSRLKTIGDPRPI